MNRPKIVAMYRIKNEKRWIKKSLEACSNICDEIVILDDGSTDNTIEICKSFKKVVDIHHQENLPLDEARDKNNLLQMAMRRNPDYLLAIDGDEIIPTYFRDILFEEIMTLYPKANVFEFQFLYMWDLPNQYRYDGYYGSIWHSRLIKMTDQPTDLHFKDSDYPGNLHCGSIPTNANDVTKPVRSKVKIFHYGYYDKELREKKYEFYTKRDPNSKFQDNYNHIISGKGKFSGPKGIELRTISDRLYIQI